MNTYENNEINAELIGWAFLPEYCIGDANSKYVRHDHKRGLFIYTNEK